MTEAKLITSNVLADPDALLELQRVATSAPDLQGVVPQVEAPAEEVLSPFSVTLMERVIQAIIYDSLESQDAEKTFSLTRALDKAGVPFEVYVQMAQSDEYKQLQESMTEALIVAPRAVAETLSLTKGAILGDRGASRILDARRESILGREQDLVRQLQAEGEDGVHRRISEMRTKLDGLLSRTRRSEAPQDVIKSARSKLLERDAGANIEEAGDIDHSSFHEPEGLDSREEESIG